MKNPSYKSALILGRLYRKVLNFKNQNPKLFECQDMNDSTNSSTKFSEKYCPFYVKVRTELNIDAQDIIYQELYSVFSNKFSSKSIIEQWSDFY
ncbi:unnamed protein product [Rotaria sordida]|uniref:Uncharacterized protein n=1 Tax=Rotaria sordida TaxID=392033 RepID=A0A819J6U0_9BILA|nr:unnamed protein product [Rotaria sordida]CAF3925557.1 unnamed protein product [Rotaria sordida]CAF4050590.1 unnamed protein product [Rotaria sordida]